MSDDLFDFVLVGFWLRHIPDQDEAFVVWDGQKKSKVAFWHHYFNRDMSTLDELLRAIMAVHAAPEGEPGGATDDIDREISRLVDTSYGRIRLAFEQHLDEVIARLPRKAYDLSGRGQNQLLAPDAVAMTDELRTRLARTITRPGQRLQLPALFANQPGRPALRSGSGQILSARQIASKTTWAKGQTDQNSASSTARQVKKRHDPNSI
jgi:hypothetical protein